MINTEHLTKHFDDLTALNDVSSSIPSGCIYGMVGSNGAGKSTFLRILAGIYKASSGVATIDGAPIYEHPEVKERIAFVPDELYFLPNATLERMMRLHRSLHKRFDEQLFHQLTALFQLDERRRLAQFSKGMKRQASIILALASQPDYLFFDETFDGLDPVMRKFVKSLICDMVAKNGATAIITSHSLRELEDICDQLALLHQGGLVLQNDVTNLRTSLFKVQLAFAEDFDQTRFEGMDICHFDKSGSVARLILRGDQEEIADRISAMQPLLFDLLPLTLEEVFTHEMESLGYTFSVPVEKEAD